MFRTWLFVCVSRCLRYVRLKLGMNLDERPNVDAKAFCDPLWKLADTVAEKVRREGRSYIAAPDFVFDDIFVMIRQAIATYNFLFTSMPTKE
jgi:hypothetical protein